MKISLMALVAGFCLVVGLPLAATAGPTPGGPNTGDSDSVENAFDNCTAVTNGNQKDVDHDGCGDICDADFNNDGVVGTPDRGILQQTFGLIEGQPSYNPVADLNCDGVIGTPDRGIFQGFFGGSPGPSGLDDCIN